MAIFEIKYAALIHAYPQFPRVQRLVKDPTKAVIAALLLFPGVSKVPLPASND